MNNDGEQPGLAPGEEDDEAAARFSREVGRREQRMLRTRRNRRAVLSGFGFFGLIGWSVVVPTLAGAALGRWLDRTWPGERSWTLALLVAGLMLGCFNAWRWVAKQVQEIEDQDGDAEESNQS